MNNRQKLVQQQFLNDEERVIARLKKVYSQSSKDIADKIDNLTFDIGKLKAEYDWLDPNDPARAKIKSMIQSKIYQKNFQEQLQRQVDGILKQMQLKEYLTVSDYLNDCYTNGFVGTIFDAHGQGIPIITPIDQASMVRAVQLESKISKGLYTRLGEDVDLLKRKITAQISRGISTGMSYAQVAKQLENYTRIGFNNAVRIARTEGHRIQTTAAMDAMESAKEKGADILKQWDATLDDNTRESHAMVDGEIREIDKPFSNGLMFPGDPSGGAAEVVNCRCAILQRAKWALDEDELQTLKDRAEYFGLDKSKNFEDFKKNYLKSVEDGGTIPANKVITKPKPSSDDKYNELLSGLQQNSVDYNPVLNHTHKLSGDEIINALAGGDLTRGSCASVGLAYIGQKQGWDVLDFRDGSSRKFFSSTFNLNRLSSMQGLKVLKAQGASSLTVGNRLLKMCETGKEYYLCVGRHAAIVRKTSEGVYQYLELQSAMRSGWLNFDTNARYTLSHRFGCRSTSDASSIYDFMIDIDESDFTSNDDFKSLLGFINTSSDAQRKGSHGTIK